MTQYSDRRFLTFPAVHPCHGISTATLLHALVALSHEICGYRSASFPALRRGLREAIREVGVLLVFLEEINNRGCVLPGSAVLGLSELHITFQQILHLLHDCAARGARLWVLMRSNWVSCELRVLIRSIATTLDVLPLASIAVDGEIKELVQLVAGQALKVVVATDPTDNLAAGNVHAILGQFEKGVAPDPADLKRVLKHLGIQTWAECNQEMLFLEEEFGYANSNSREGEFTLLSSLIGFMTYCRGVVFDVVDGRKSDQSDCKLEGEVLNHLTMDNFRCPISLELMVDPVTVSTGQTYDRASIVRWIKAGNVTCPVTGEKLMHTELVPNSAIKKLIQQFCHNNSISIPELSHRSRRHSSKALLPISSAASEATRMLANFLVGRLSNGTKDRRNKATYEIRLLSKSGIFNRACLVEAGSVPQLLNLLSSTNPWIQETAIAAVLNLSKHPKGRKVIFDLGGLSPILDVLRKGHKIEAQQNAAATLFYLSSVDEYRQAIGEIAEAIPALARLLRNGTARGKKNAVVAIFGLLLFPGNHGKVLAAGTIPNLLNLLSSEREDLVSDSLAVLATLAERPEGANAVLRSSSAVPKLVEILCSSTSRAAKEYCVSVLLSLCNNGGAKVVYLLDRVPSLMSSLYSLLTEGSSRASKKASSLISILHHFHDPSIPAIIAPAVQQERVVHVQ